jgi:hypothetical protein
MLDSGKSTIKALPMHDPGEYMFIVLKENVTDEAAEKSIAQLKRPFEDKSYSLIDGMRSPIPMVDFKGEKMTLTEAIDIACKGRKKIKYTTAWRRLQRGWTIEQTLGLEDAPPRWGKPANGS